MKVALASFDVVPSRKGASSHILANARALARDHDVSLVTLGTAPVAGLRHRPIHIAEPNWLRRGLEFERRVARVFARNPFDIFHVRSPWEGFAVPPDRPLVYEVNALYSIEAGYHHPRVASRVDLRRRLRARELCLLDRADRIVTPSNVTAQYLEDLGAPADRIRVVPNAPEIEPRERPPERAPGPVRICYVGTLAPWQGLPELLHRLPRLDQPFDLTIVSSGPRRRLKWVRKLIRKGSLENRVRVVDPMGPADLADFLATQEIGLAPLLPNERNLVQGCNPIKLLDYAAAGLAILAPDMPVVRDILGADYLLYRRWSRSAMIETLGELVASAELRDRLAAIGRARVAAELSRARQAERLLATYRELTA